MSDKLKIIIGDTASNTMVFVGDRQIGLIQELTVNVIAGCTVPIIKIVFPDYKELKEFWKDPNTKYTFLNSVDESVELLKQFPNVEVSFKSLLNQE